MYLNLYKQVYYPDAVQIVTKFQQAAAKEDDGEVSQEEEL